MCLRNPKNQSFSLDFSWLGIKKPIFLILIFLGFCDSLQRTGNALEMAGDALQRTGGALDRTGGALSRTDGSLYRTCVALQRTD